MGTQGAPVSQIPMLRQPHALHLANVRKTRHARCQAMPQSCARARAPCLTHPQQQQAATARRLERRSPEPYITAAVVHRPSKPDLWHINDAMRRVRPSAPAPRTRIFARLRASRCRCTRNGEAPVVVLCHGLLGFQRVGVGRVSFPYWTGLERRLGARGFRLVNPVVPMTGSIESRAKALAAQIPDCCVHIVGHSMGGCVSGGPFPTHDLTARPHPGLTRASLSLTSVDIAMWPR